MTNQMDPLTALLATEKPNIEREVPIKRLNTTFTVRNVDSDELEKIAEQSTYYVGKGKDRRKERDPIKETYLTIAAGTVKPDFNDKKLKEHYGVDEAWLVAKASLLPGEVTLLETEIAIASGFGDDSEEDPVEKVKN